MRAIVVIAALTMACSPQAPAPEPQLQAAQEEVAPAEAVGALQPVLEAEIGQPLSLEVNAFKLDGDWAFLTVQPRKPDGAPLDWMTTNFAERYENGVLDADGQCFALLKRENGAWRVVDHLIGPTDVGWLAWTDEHGAPASLFE